MANTLREIGLNLSENEYRELPCLSYSMLSRYDREGYGEIDNINKPISSPSLTFGSMVDCLLTSNDGEFQKRFAICDFSLPSDSIMEVIDALMSESDAKQFGLVADCDIVTAANAVGYQRNWKDATRVAKIRELGSEYFRFKRMAEGKMVVSKKDVDAAVHAAESMSTSPMTSRYFRDSAFGDSEVLFQWQYKSIDYSSGVEYKVMLDVIHIDHVYKVIQPCDIKTTRSIYTFEDSFFKYRYYLQASLYTQALRDAVLQCKDLANYVIAPFRFLAIDRTNFVPMVFEWEPTAHIVTKGGHERKSHDVLLKELDWALKNRGENVPYEWHEQIAKDGIVRIKNNIANVDD